MKREDEATTRVSPSTSTASPDSRSPSLHQQGQQAAWEGVRHDMHVARALLQELQVISKVRGRLAGSSSSRRSQQHGNGVMLYQADFVLPAGHMQPTAGIVGCVRHLLMRRYTVV